MDFAMNQVSFEYGSVEEAFPAIEPGIQPLGSRVIVQMKRPKSRTKGGIILVDDVKDTEKWNTQVAKVVSCGPLAFHNRNTMTPWPEGAWVQPGDFVRVPKYGGDRWAVTHKDDSGEEEIIFVIFDDLNLIGKVKDPLSVKAYL